jgi:hypothetical protein
MQSLKGLIGGLGLALMVTVGNALAAPAPSAVAGTLEWRSKENTVNADFENWRLRRLLEVISAKTRWQVYVEPGVDHTVSARFHGLTTNEALTRLLGSLNFALVSDKGRPARLYIFQTTRQTATDLIVAPPETSGRGKAIPNELIVKLKPGAKESADELARRLGAKITGRLDGVHAYRLQFDDAAAAQAAQNALTGDASVGSVEPNYSVSPPVQPELMSGAGMPAFNLKPSTDGSQVVVGLVDTAVQTQDTPLKDFLLPSLSVVSDAVAPPADQLTHGTSMAETMLNALSQAATTASSTPVRILPVDVYGGADTTTTFQIAQGIQAAVNGGATIVNLSLGGSGDSPLLHDLITAASNQGIVFLAAAGNQPVTTPTYPAAYPEVIPVTATLPDGSIASYANRGSFVTDGAPGTSIVPFNGQAYLVVGTSVSTANGSALTAYLAATGGKSGSALDAQARQLLALKPGATAP